jgi:anthranilate phosphoribosyltransferase
MILRDLLRVLGSSDRRNGRNLTHEEAFRAFDTILSGSESEIRIGAFLIALRWKGVTVEELTGFARAARERATIPCRELPGLVALCTPLDGYDAAPPLEVAAGLVAAGAGTRVLMVTDRCVPPHRGLTAASVLEHLGPGISWDPADAEASVKQVGFGAISASGMLPALLNLRRVRSEIGVRTPLQTVEKLIVPPAASVVVGAQQGPVLGTAVETMAGLGHPSSIVLQGRSGGIVPSLKKRTRGIELSGKHQVPLVVDPADFGLQCDSEPELPLFGPPDEGQGSGDNPVLVKAAGDVVDAVLKGEHGAPRSATLLTAALVLKVVGRVLTLAEGVDAAVTSLDSGAALAVLEKLRARR